MTPAPNTPGPFAAKLAALMTARGVGVRALAAKVPCDPGLISRYRSGGKRPSPEMAARLDAVLGAGGELAAAPTAEPVPARVDPATVDVLAQQLDGLRRLEDTIGAAPVVPVVAAGLGLIGGLLREARGATRPALVHQAAQWSQYAGWTTAAGGSVTRGCKHLSTALEWATEAGDPDLISEVLSFRGNLAYMSGDIGAMVGLSHAAIRDASNRGVYPGQVAIAAMQAAIGHATRGEEHEMRALLDQSDEQADAADPDGAPPWLYYHVPGFFAAHRGRAYLALARHCGSGAAYARRSVEVLSGALDEFPAEVQGSEWVAGFRDDLTDARRLAGDTPAA